MRTAQRPELHSSPAQSPRGAGELRITEHDDGTLEVLNRWHPEPSGPGPWPWSQRRIRIRADQVDVEVRTREDGGVPTDWHPLTRLGPHHLGAMVPIPPAIRLLAAL